MALGLDDIVESAALPAVLLGIGVAATAPLLLRGLNGSGRPVVKAIVHKYLDLADKVKEMGAEAQEQWLDLVAEVRAERAAAEAMREPIESA